MIALLLLSTPAVEGTRRWRRFLCVMLERPAQSETTPTRGETASGARCGRPPHFSEIKKNVAAVWA